MHHQPPPSFLPLSLNNEALHTQDRRMEGHGQHQRRKTHTRQEEEEQREEELEEEEEEEEEIHNVQTEIFNNSNNETNIQESKQQLKRELTVNASKQKAASIIRAQQREARSKHIQRQFSGAARRALEQSRSFGHQRDTRTNTTQDDAVEPLLKAEGGTEEQRKQGENTNNARDGDGENDENETRMDKRRRNDGGGYDADEIEVSTWTKNGKRVWYDMRGDARGIWNVVTGSRVNALLIVVPFGMASKLAGWNPLAVFWLNFVSIIPLAWLLGQATEDIALWTGDVFGGLINATLGNVVEIIIGIAALNQDLITIIQTSLLGSIFSNMVRAMHACTHSTVSQRLAHKGKIGKIILNRKQTPIITPSPTSVCHFMCVRAVAHLSAPRARHMFPPRRHHQRTAAL